MDAFSAASHDDVLQLVAQIALLLAMARLLGGLAQKLNQPSVVGEILAGVVLGPSLLAGALPTVGEWILPRTEVQGFLLEAVALIGVMLLLVVTGLETDLALIRRKARTAIGVAIGGLVLPFAAGIALGFAIPDDLLTDPSQRTVFVLFLATALSISAIPVLAKVLIDLDLMRRDIGQTLLAAGMIDDITGWTLLGIVTALASAAAITPATILRTVGMVFLFLAATVTVGAWLVNQGLAFVQDRFRGQDRMLTLVVVLAFAWGAFSQALHLEPVLGAFAIGILFGRSPRLPVETIRRVEAIAIAVFAPIFFAVAGLKVDISAILEPRLLLMTLTVIAVATFGKVVGAYAGARWISGQDHWSGLAFGSGLNARGALEIIIATIGLSLGILTQTMFSIIVVMAVVTSLMAPVALRYTISRLTLDVGEQDRLRLEAALQRSFLGGVRRVLVPVRPRPEGFGHTRVLQVSVLNRLASLREMSITLIAVVPAGERASAASHLAELETLFDNPRTNSRVLVGDDSVRIILAEAERDYDLMTLGTPAADEEADSLFGPLIDDLVRLSPCPTLLVRGIATEGGLRRILVPTNGTVAARRAAELAFAIATNETAVEGLHVVTPSLVGAHRDQSDEFTAELKDVGDALGKTPRTSVRHADSAESGILSYVAETQPDLMILGTQVRAGTTRLHLGPRVEILVRMAQCPVVVINT
ncbi:MAG TPA: cation:proton antiporter [Acidimicrobiia bacterium]|nr:cation:proton antiporter [Acidimicrobiia bacterium]